jgi:hypothetical protein
MKKIIIAFVSLLPLLGISQTKNQGIKISGQIKNVMDTIDWIFLSYYDYENSKRITDSAKVTDGGIYHFNLKNNEPLAVSLRARNSAGLLKRPAKKDFASVYLQPGNITIESVDSFSNVKVTGSKAHIEFEKLNVLSKSYEDQMQEVYKKYSEAKKEGKLEEAAKFDAQADSINDK